MPLVRGGTWLAGDGLGSITALMNGSGGATGLNRYEPFGELSPGSTGGSSLYQFTGRDQDGTGLMYYRARYYAPEWGRFISEDPIGLAGGLNGYAYALNNPVSATDPSGLAADTPLDLAIVGVDIGFLLYDAFSGAPRHVITGDISNAMMDTGFAALPFLPNVVGGARVLARAGAFAHAIVMSTEFERLNTLRRLYSFARAATQCPNPGGRLGSPEHRAKVQERAAELEKEGHEIISGGGGAERAVDTPAGKRFPDIITKDQFGNPYFENIGRTTKSGQPVSRERRVMDEIEQGTRIRPHFTPYR
jgi:RHS repeat-associated protein